MTVYFLRYNDLIKIGFSSNLATRVRSIINTSPVPVEYLGQMPGDREVEAHLHDRFSADRFSGEWFRATDRLLTLIDIVAIREMPTERAVPKGISKRRFDSDDVAAQMSHRMRLAATARWPLMVNLDRMPLIAAELKWTNRRVRSFYNLEGNTVLRSVEAEELNEWLLANEPKANAA